MLCHVPPPLFPNGEIGHDRPWTERYSDENQDKAHIVNVNRFHCIFPSPVLVLASESQIQIPLAGFPLFLSAFWIGRS